jgi:hypothetical protein
MAGLTGFSKHKVIPISHANVDADLTNFPVYVPIVDDADIGAICRSDGFDVQFANSDNSETLTFERLPGFAVAGGQANGNFYVLVPTVAGASDTIIRCYYGKADATDVSSPENTFATANGWAAVWHGCDGSSNAYIYDSVSEGNLGTKGTAGEPTEGTGLIYKEQNFDGGDYIDVGNPVALQFGTAISVFAWLTPSSSITSAHATWWRKGLDDTNGCILHINYTDGKAQGWVGPDTWWKPAAPDLRDNLPHFVVFASDASAKWFYIDGTKYAGTAQAYIANTGSNGYIGAQDSGPSGPFIGDIEKIWICSTLRSDAFTKFAFYNSHDGHAAGNEISWGAEEGEGEVQPLAGVIGAISSTSGDLKALREVNGISGATSEVAGSLKPSPKLAGTSDAISATDGVLKVLQRVEHWAVSLSPADIQAASDLCVDGDTVVLPAGSWSGTWTTVDFANGVSLRGAGKSMTSITKTNVAHEYMFRWNYSRMTVTYAVEVKDFTLYGQNPDSSTDGGIVFYNADAMNDWKIHDVALRYFGLVGVEIKGYCRGVIYDSDFIDNYGAGLGYGICVGGHHIDDETDTGETVWSLFPANTNPGWGGAQFVFIEDCYFYHNRHDIASNDGARYVFRYNDCVDGSATSGGQHIDTHGGQGIGSGRRGTRAVEVYHNTIRNPGGVMTDGIMIAGGDLLIYDNDLGPYIVYFGIRDSGYTGQFNTHFADAGGGQVTVTTYDVHGWVNGTNITVIGTVHYDGAYSISNVSAYTFEITHSWDGDDGLIGQSFVTSSYPFSDQVRNGYCWDNRKWGDDEQWHDMIAYGNGDNYTIAIQWAMGWIQADRDVFIGEPGGYTPYIYPHPLREEGEGEVQPLAGVIGAISSTSGALKALREINGISGATSEVAGSLKPSPKLAGTSDAISATDGVLKVLQRVGGISGATSSTSGALKALREVNGISGAISSTSGDLKALREINGISGAISSTSGALKALREVNGISGATSEVAGSLKTSPKLAGTSDAISATDGVLKVLQRVGGISGATSSVAGVIERTCKIAGSIAAGSSVVGLLRPARRITGTSTVMSQVGGILAVIREITGVIGATLLSVGGVARTRRVSGVSDVTSQVVGGLRTVCRNSGVSTITSYVTGVLESVHGSSGVSEAVSQVVGVLCVVKKLGGTSAAESQVGGLLVQTERIVGGSTVVSQAGGFLSRIRRAAGISESASQAIGSLTGAYRIAGVSLTLSEIVGVLERTRRIIGISSTLSQIIGELVEVREFVGVCEGVSQINGDLVKSRRIAGVSEAITQVSGALKRQREIYGTVSAASAITGDLSRHAIGMLSGVVTAAASIVGESKIAARFVGVSEAALSTAGVLKATWRVSGDVGAVSTIVGVLRLCRGVLGTSTAVAAVSGVLKEAKRFLCSSEVGSTTTATLERGRAIQGISQVVSAVSGVVSMARIALSGESSAVGSAIGVLERSRRVAGASDSTSGVSGGLRRVGRFLVFSEATSSAIGILERVRRIAGVSGATASVVGGLKTAGPFSGFSEAQSSVVGNLRMGLRIQGVSQAAVSIVGVVKQEAAFGGVSLTTSVLSAVVKVAKGLSGVVAAVVSADGGLKLSERFVGFLESVASVVGVFTVKGRVDLSGGFVAVSDATGFLRSGERIYGLVSAASAVSGLGKRIRWLIGSSPATSSSVGAVKVATKLLGRTDASVSAAGWLRLWYSLAAGITGSASVIGILGELFRFITKIFYRVPLVRIFDMKPRIRWFNHKREGQYGD